MAAPREAAMAAFAKKLAAGVRAISFWRYSGKWTSLPARPGRSQRLIARWKRGMIPSIA
jgi:hypothetical protein